MGGQAFLCKRGAFRKASRSDCRLQGGGGCHLLPNHRGHRRHHTSIPTRLRFWVGARRDVARGRTQGV